MKLFINTIDFIKEKIIFLNRFFSLAKTWGMKNIIFFIPYEIFYGFKFKTNTLFNIPVNKMDVNKNFLKASNEYIPTPYYILYKVFNLINLKKINDINFIDFGCGAGRALCFALLFNPKKIIGVELSKSLCDLSINNLSKYKYKQNNNICFDILNISALDYKFNNSENIIFFYDPFGPNVMNSVLSNLNVSLKKNKRSIYLIYVSPIHSNLFLKFGFKEIFSEITKYKKGFKIFVN